MNHPERARRYLQASLSSSYTGLPKEHRDAYEAQMRAHERAYPGVREHALIGADRDFDEPLTAGEREHQQHLRRQEGITHGQVLDARKKLRSQSSPRRRSRSSSSGSNTRRVASGLLSGAGGALDAGTTVLTGSKGGSTVMMFVGVGLLLTLAYLLLSGKGVNAVGGLANTFAGGLRAFIAPQDPIAKLQQALGANPSSSSSSRSTTTSATGGQPGEAAAAANYAAGKTAPAPQVAGSEIPSRLPPASLLRADLALRARSRRLLSEHRITAAQAHAREEALIPRSKYPAFYINGSS